MLMNFCCAWAQAEETEDSPSVASVQVLQVEHPVAGPGHINVGKLETDAGHIQSVLEQIPADKDLLVSTDSEEVATQILQKSGRSGLTRLIPLGRLKDRLVTFKNHTIQSVKKDKIGFVIVAFNTMYDSFIWIHATQYSPQERAAQVIFGTLTSIAFSLDKDAWARCAGYVKNRLFKVLDLAGDSKAADLMGRFTANLAISLGIQGARLGILSMDKVIDLPTLAGAAGNTFLLGLGLTFGNFAWTEFSRMVDDSTHPATKFLVRRFAEVRSIIMGHLSPSSKLLQTNVYGYAPWVALAIHGTVGLAVFFNDKVISNWSEGKFGALFTRKKVQLENLWGSMAEFANFSTAPVCHEVFL
jgi:hypothetical protein